MSYYRDTYLKSPEWEHLRNQVLEESQFTCEVCRVQSHAMDVHHLRYKRLYDVTKADLRSVCRGCHDKVHALLKKYPKLKKLEPRDQWRVCMQRLGDGKRSLSAIRQSKMLIFGRMRDFLCSLRLVKREKMIGHPSLCAPEFIPIRKRPLLYLKQYMAATGIDPRYRFERIGAQKLLTWPSRGKT